MSIIQKAAPAGGKPYVDGILHYGRLTGIMVWKRSEGRARRGSVAGYWGEDGIYVRIDGIRYAAHHIAWLMHYGEWPKCEIDHANGDPTDNRILNLRRSTRQGQTRNQRRKASGTSMFKGVSRHSQYPVWVVRIRTDEGRKSLGCFHNEEEAARAYDEAARRYHGEFACLNFPNEHERSAL